MQDKKKQQKKRGRPTTYSKAMAELICERVSTHTIGLARLCQMYDDMPNKDTVNAWRSLYPEFSAQYAQAKIKQADLLAEEIIDIADDATNDWMESLSDDEQSDGWRFNSEHFQRSRLRIDTRKWLASKLLPKQYGDQRQIDELSGQNEALREELRALRATLDEKNRKDY